MNKPTMTVTNSSIPYLHATANTIPSDRKTLLPSSAWTVVQSNQLVLNEEGTVTLPHSGMWVITATQDNQVNASAIGIYVFVNESTYQTFWQAVPATGITNSSQITNTISIYADAGTRVGVMYDWDGNTQVQASPSTIFTVTSASTTQQ
jgi:hypothetical protein